MTDPTGDVERAREEAFPPSETPPGEEPKERPKRRGAPKGRVPWNKGLRKGDKLKASQEAPKEPAEPSEEEVAGLGFAASVLWGLVGSRVGLEPLNEEEALQLGGALARVVKKYLPSYGQYDPEIGLALVLIGLVTVKYKGKPKPQEPEGADEGESVPGGTDPRNDAAVRARFAR